MSKELMNITMKNNIQEILKNSHFEIHLDGWSATAAIIGICASGVAVYGIKMLASQQVIEDKRESI